MMMNVLIMLHAKTNCVLTHVLLMIHVQPWLHVQSLDIDLYVHVLMVILVPLKLTVDHVSLKIFIILVIITLLIIIKSHQ